jgi:hypothetical protein
MNEHTKALSLLAEAAGKAPRGVPHPMPTSRDPVYDFEHLGNTLADSMAAAADDLTEEANRIAQDARVLAADIRSTVEKHSQLMLDINTRLKATGEQMLEVHRKFNGT